MRTNLTYIFFACLFSLLSSALVSAQEIDTIIPLDAPAIKTDSLPRTTQLIETLPTDRAKDSTETDSTDQEPGLLKYNIKQSAKDKIRFDRKNERAYLYDEAKIEYGDMTLEAGLIVLDNKRREVYAYGVEDTTGHYSQRPVFTQGNREVEPDSLRFNMDTKKALVYNSRTEQDEFNIKGETTKRVNDSVYFMEHVKFTTAEDIEDPEYYFYARKVKYVPGQKVVSGLVNMYIADVPTPLGLPFGYFPMTHKRTAGFIIPSIGNHDDRGYSLQNGGYYFPISDYIDITALGDYYTNGSYGFRLESSYAKRYRYSGNFSFRYEKLISSEKGFPDYSESTIYNLQWRHQQDSKANPNSRFSASVNLGSSKYYRESVNESNSGNHLNNNLSSSVSYSRTFPGDPEFDLSLTATHNQNTNTEEINMTLPTLKFSMSRVYPFAPKHGVKKGALQNINFQYDLRGENRYKTDDENFMSPEMFRTAKTGFQHKIPLSTNFKLFRNFSVSMGGNYEEDWVFNTYEQSYNEEREEVVMDTVNGFDSYRTYNFNTSVGTTLYGLFDFGEDKKIQAVRHVMKPNISYSLTPSFDNFYDTYLIPATSGADEEVVEYSKFENTLFGAPNKNFASSIGFSLSNEFEAKIKDSADADTRKRKLLKNLKFSTSYNFAADSLKLQPVTFSGTLPIVEDKFDVNFNGALDPYALNNKNQRINRLNVNNGGSLFRLTRANMSFSYSFSSSDFEGDEEGKNTDKDENETFRNGGRADDLFGKNTNRDGGFDENEDEEPEEDETDRYNYKIPWDLRVAYTMTYNNARRQNEISSHSIMFSGNIELSPRWKVGFSSGYDLKNKGFTYTQLRFQRDLKSWRMSFNWTPFGNHESWYFFIGIKANILRDIKYDKRRRPDQRL